ncbi:MAG: nuclease [Thermoleophilia bacterium]|nr:nuclease [Thermoleophilia bacterium]
MRYDLDTRRHSGSATDLANHARCEFLTDRARELAVAIAEGRAERETKRSLVIEKGREFEASYVARRRAEVEAADGRFIDCSEVGDDLRAHRLACEQAMRDGIELIAQAPMRSASLFGYADLLERIADADIASGSLDTVHRYEPVEIKYARSTRPEHLLQASAYADALELLQGVAPREIHVVTGDGARHDFQTSEYVEYFRAARERFVAALETDLPTALERMPEPVAHCAGCDFADVCQARWVEADHLSLVAGIRTDQRGKLHTVGIETLAQLAATELEHVPGIGRATLPRLVTQARLQRDSRDGDAADTAIAYRRPGDDEPSGRGFAMLPDPHVDDMFFDFEGYPYHERGALEYLWGWTTRSADGELSFDHIWADDPAAEAAAFAAFLDEVEARRERSGGRMHVFHYAPYEITALRRLAKEHPHEMPRLDALLRQGVFVDLYAVVRQAMQVGRPSYSIKQLEPLYGISRAGDDLADGGASIEVYEQWLNDGDSRVRETIIDYNRVDCDSTLALRDWLLEHRDLARTLDGIVWPPALEPDANDDEPSDEPSSEPSETRTLVERLERIAEDEAHGDDVRLAARLLSAMPGWQRRISREFFGDLHGRKHDRHPEDDVTDPNVLADLRLVGVDEAPKGARPGTIERTYRFPDQVHMVEVGHDAIDPAVVETVGSVRALDVDECTVTIRTSTGQADKLKAVPRDWQPRSIIGWTEISVFPLEQAAKGVAQQLLDCLDAGRDPFAPGERCAAALSVLARRPTRVTSGGGPELVGDPPDIGRVADLIRRAEGSHVIVQGPPGTGKTYTSARLIAELVESGLRVGISSNSHDAVINVLCGIDKLREERLRDGCPLTLRAAYALRHGEKAPGTFGFGDDWIERPRSTNDAVSMLADGDVQVLAGTAWALAKSELLDVLLVDEAGQVSLLHLTAMASGARRVVLVGDPQQLPQPAEVQHPHGCGASALEHLFGDEPVLPHERAVLLPETRRMHPDVCEFISTTYYRGELRSHPSTAIQRVDAAHAAVPTSGTHLLRVDHVGNRASSPEEVEAIRVLVSQLLDGGRVVPHPDEAERPIQPEDIIVVAPYNAQRRALRRALGDDIAVGTVDKFQGQEAPIAIVSMTASSRDELPRGLEFLLDPHRLNVAISRARALSIVVASPALLATSATSLREMRLLNDLVRFARTSTDRSS